MGEIFDGTGCVEAFLRRGLPLAGQRVMLIGLGGAGSAIAAAVAGQQPALMRLHDLDAARCALVLVERLRGSLRRRAPAARSPSVLKSLEIVLITPPLRYECSNRFH